MSYPGWFGIDYYDVDTWEQMDNTRKAIADAAFAVGSTKIDDWDGEHFKRCIKDFEVYSRYVDEDRVAIEATI